MYEIRRGKIRGGGSDIMFQRFLFKNNFIKNVPHPPVATLQNLYTLLWGGGCLHILSWEKANVSEDFKEIEIKKREIKSWKRTWKQ